MVNAVSSKLPVLFVSCDADALELQGGANSALSRMVLGKHYRGMVVISIGREISAPVIYHLKGDGSVRDNIQSLLSSQGVVPETVTPKADARDSLLGQMLSDSPGELVELVLNLGMTELEYRRFGMSLEGLREQDYLVICLDDKANRQEGGHVLLHNRHLREMLNGWVENQKWSEVMSFKGQFAATAPADRLDDPTICLLNAAFTLGGSCYPQRMFSSGMSNGDSRLSGFGWMR